MQPNGVIVFGHSNSLYNCFIWCLAAEQYVMLLGSYFVSLATGQIARGTLQTPNREPSSRTLIGVYVSIHKNNDVRSIGKVNEMSNNGYAVGAVKIADVSSVRKWEFTQLISFKTLYMVYAGFENGFFQGALHARNHFSSYFQQLGAVLMSIKQNPARSRKVTGKSNC